MQVAWQLFMIVSAGKGLLFNDLKKVNENAGI